MIDLASEEASNEMKKGGRFFERQVKFCFWVFAKQRATRHRELFCGPILISLVVEGGLGFITLCLGRPLSHRLLDSKVEDFSLIPSVDFDVRFVAHHAHTQ